VRRRNTVRRTNKTADWRCQGEKDRFRLETIFDSRNYYPDGKAVPPPKKEVLS